MRLTSFIVVAAICVAAPGERVLGNELRPRVTLASGVLEGTLPADAPGAVFKGIPFAQPPVGALRWRAPVEVHAWPGIRDASEFAASCAQTGRGGPGSEDCLYLNVWTPEWPLRGSYPVMLWIHGGANVAGTASMAAYDGAALARQGVVVVTANHRLGAMGFLAHKALSAESPQHSSGNYALLDILMALRWTQDHIARFGGDPRRVTLFGQSSGSYNVLLLMTSPLARGLFSRVIAQSGQLLSYDGSMPKARAEDLGAQLAADLNAPAGAEALAYLRSLPVEQVLAAAAQRLPTSLGSDTGLLTNVDGWVLPELPARAFAAGRQLPVPMIIGQNAREITPQVSIDELRAQIHAKYGELAPKALQAYGLADGGQGHTDSLLGGAAAQWMTDTVQRCAAIMEAEWHAAASHPVWQYQFERSIPGREGVGSYHGAELGFVFGTLDKTGQNTAPYSAADYLASRQMQAYWARFANTSDPNGGSLPRWPTAGQGRYLAFTAQGPMVKSNLQSGPCDVYREWMQQRLAH